MAKEDIISIKKLLISVKIHSPFVKSLYKNVPSSEPNPNTTIDSTNIIDKMLFGVVDNSNLNKKPNYWQLKYLNNI